MLQRFHVFVPYANHAHYVLNSVSGCENSSRAIRNGPSFCVPFVDLLHLCIFCKYVRCDIVSYNLFVIYSEPAKFS
jgi:hypothetical protein